MHGTTVKKKKMFVGHDRCSEEGKWEIVNG
jgi:hypothetical protein